MTLIAVGRLKSGPERQLCEDYLKRLRWKLTIIEIEEAGEGPQRQAREQAAILAAFDKAKPDRLIVLDERGQDLDSRDFAQKLSNWMGAGASHVGLVIGGADGLTEEIRQRADLLLCLGRLTWPHLLVRPMLLEQLYRGQQILAGHPYHRG